MSITRSKWTAALRSGKYTQIQGDLTNKGGLCCLGVACVVAGFQDKMFETHKDGKPALVTGVDIGKVDPSLPVDLGITTSDMLDLVDLNDQKNFTFSEIADYIDLLPFSFVTVDANGIASARAQNHETGVNHELQREAMEAVIRCRDYCAEHNGAYDPKDFHPSEDQGFDDWAADILSAALGAQNY